MPDIEKCEICGKTSNDASITDAILDNDIIKICTMCARVESAVLIPEPSKNQLIEADRPYTVYERLVRVSGVDLKSNRNLQKERNRGEVTLNSLQDDLFKKRLEESIPEIQSLQEASKKKTDIDFKSKTLKIADLQNMREKFFVDMQKNQKKEEKRDVSAEELIE